MVGSGRRCALKEYAAAEGAHGVRDLQLRQRGGVDTQRLGQRGEHFAPSGQDLLVDLGPWGTNDEE
jgi:hypothetical protein